ncbi:Protein of unknown function [Bacillus cereus]|nr:Protein of unknown function [Bacillus cereus]SCN43840.1 Protein of unknown function [Bacillus wiedmannii]
MKVHYKALSLLI